MDTLHHDQHREQNNILTSKPFLSLSIVALLSKLKDNFVHVQKYTFGHMNAKDDRCRLGHA